MIAADEFEPAYPSNYRIPYRTRGQRGMRYTPARILLMQIRLHTAAQFDTAGSRWPAIYTMDRGTIECLFKVSIHANVHVCMCIHLDTHANVHAALMRPRPLGLIGNINTT